jgi:hypothetical protein
MTAMTRRANRRWRQASDQELRQRLREGDPAADRSEPAQWQWAAMRQRAMRAAGSRAGTTQPRIGNWAWTAVAAAALVALLLGPRLFETPVVEQVPSAADRATAQAQAPTAAEERPARSLQFSTSNGTRVIWTLDPRFEPPEALRSP